MKNIFWKRIAAMGLAATVAVTALAGCGGNKDDADKESDVKDASFSWWIYQIDGEGTFYETYEQNPGAQYLAQQYWDVENGGLGTEENGTKLDISYVVPVRGSEVENFNTMISTGEYPDVIDMCVQTDSPQALCENGILMDITKYVKEYMPNYLAYLDAHPEVKPFVQSTDDEGNIHYYAVYNLKNGVDTPWEGYSYRRDWIVKYAVPTDYVWDWDDEYVAKNGHPEVTPLAKAKEENNLNGWKKNEVTKFEADYGADPDNDYTDNVIFPSGKSDPITISDWEWMFEAFAKALNERGETENSSAYCFTIYYTGAMTMGDLVSSFGGGTGSYYVKDGKVSYDGTSENFKTYVECMNHWYEEGWLDSQFNTRSNEVFFMVNTAGVNQGIVGMWTGLPSSLGISIRPSCKYEEDQQDAYTMACALPINDTYGTEEQMYKEPDSLYQDSKIGSPVGVTTKAKDKDLATLFTFMDWTYTPDGGATMFLGLTEEQYNSVTLEPDLYKELGYTAAYSKYTNEEGKIVWEITKEPEDLGAPCPARLGIGLQPANNSEEIVDKGEKKVVEDAYKAWSQYMNTGNVFDYTSLLSSEEADAYNKVNTLLSDYVGQNLPGVIKEGMGKWDSYVEGINALDPESVSQYLQKYLDLTKSNE